MSSRLTPKRYLIPLFITTALDCVRESLRLGLQELEAIVGAPGRPVFWVELWERYVESQVDYRTTVETLGRKLGEAGRDVWQLLEWLPSCKAGGRNKQLRPSSNA